MRKRNGFTLVELIVVIAIITILISLVLAAVMMVGGKNRIARTRVEMMEIENGLEQFKLRHSIYPPSQITVAPSKDQCDGNGQYFLTRIWPNLDFAEAFGPNGMDCGGQPRTIKGDQCLVLFLGGRHDAVTAHGFSTSKKNPFALGGDHDPPYTKFQTGQLFQRDPASPFCSYGDGFYKTSLPEGQSKSCYAYFAPNRSGYDDSHCSTVTDTRGNYPKPYKNAAGVYLNTDSYQLLSAGNDTYWGNARVYTKAAGIGDMGADPSNKFSVDNMANFSGCALLGGG